MSEKTMYNDFGRFMEACIEDAKRRSDILKKNYDIKNILILATIILILKEAGFDALVLVCLSLVLGWFGLAVEIPALLSTPIGWAIVAIFGATTGGIIWKLYRDRKIVIAIKNVGKRVKATWELLVRTKLPEKDFDTLLKEVVVALLVGPEKFYKKPLDPDVIISMYNDFMRKATS